MGMESGRESLLETGRIATQYASPWMGAVPEEGLVVLKESTAAASVVGAGCYLCQRLPDHWIVRLKQPHLLHCHCTAE